MFVHVSLSRPAGADLTPAQWAKTCQVFLKKIDAEGCNFAVTRHKNTEHDHVHLVFSRAKPDGKLVSMSNNRWAWRQACREVEQEMGIQVADQPTERQTAPAPTSDRVVSAQRRATRQGAPDPFIDPNVIARALAGSTSPEQLSAALQAAQIEVKTAEKNGKVAGILFRKVGVAEWLAGSSIDRNLSLSKVNERLDSNRQALQTQEQQIQFQRQRQAIEQQRQQQVIQSPSRPKG